MTIRSSITGFLLGLSIVLSLEKAQAMRPTALPADLTLTDSKGQKSKSSALPITTNWVLVYISARSHASELTLKSLEKSQPPAAIPKLVIVIHGSANDAAKAMSKHAGLATSSWYVDADGKVFRSLHLRNMPSVVGVDHATIRWKLGGPMAATGKSQSAIQGWIREGAQSSRGSN